MNLEILNNIGKKTWLVATCSILYENQLHFRVDGFPMIKFHITKGGNLKVIYNECKDKPHYPEDAAFQFASFAVGKIVRWEKFAEYLQAWVAISNLRLQLAGRYKEFVFDPHKHVVHWNCGNCNLGVGDKLPLRLPTEAQPPFLPQLFPHFAAAKS